MNIRYADEEAVEDVFPRMVFRDCAGNYLRLKREIDVTKLARAARLDGLLLFIGNLNATYGDHFYLDIGNAADKVTMVVW